MRHSLADLDITITDLAKLAGVDRSRVSRWLNGQEIRSDAVEAIVLAVLSARDDHGLDPLHIDAD